MKELLGIYEILLNTYGRQNWWPAKTSFEMMVGAVLTQNTAWKNVEKAIANFGEQLTPEYIAEADQNDLAQIIRSSGYYNQKAARLKALTAWFKKYNYDIKKAAQLSGDDLRSELLALKGIGRETADSILVYALDKLFFIVDAYTIRIFGRLGYDLSYKYEDIRCKIEKSLPRDIYIYNEFHALIVYHAKSYCQKKPTCCGCPLESKCVKKIAE